MNLRGQLAVGLNCTARCLERGTLRVVLVDRNTQPAILTRHLVPSAAVNKCPILFINQLARTLAPELGISSLCALGIKKLSKGDESDLNELVEFLASQAVPIDIPWLKCEQNTDPNQHTKSDGTTEPGHNCNADPVLKADPNENADPNGTGPRLQTVTKEESVIEQLHASLMKNKPIDFDKIYVQKSSSELTDGKIKPFEFGSVGFVEFDASSDDEFIVCRRKGETNRAGKRKKKSKGVKRKSTNEPVYETARIGKIRNNEDRSSVKYKKKKK